MKIVVFSELFYPDGGGAELATFLYSKLLGERGLEIKIVTSNYGNELPADHVGHGVQIIRVPVRVATGSRYDTLAYLGIMASPAIKEAVTESDVIWVPGGWYSVIPLAKMHRKPVVVHLHNYSIACPTSIMYDFVKKRVGPSSAKSFILHEMIEKKRRGLLLVASSLTNELFGKYYNRLGLLADALVFVSKAQRDLVLSRWPGLGEKSYVVKNPIPEVPHIEADEKGIGYFGGISFVKGFHVLMQALRRVRFPADVYLGMTSKEHRIERLSNGVTLNFLPRVSLGNIMKKLSVVIVPSLFPEPSPYVLIESMLYGKIVIASDVGGIPEITKGAGSGTRLVNPDPYQVAHAIESVLSLDLAQMNELGMRNRTHALQYFNNKESSDSMSQLLRSMCMASQL